jgi:hypothetical protein
MSTPNHNDRIKILRLATRAASGRFASEWRARPNRRLQHVAITVTCGTIVIESRSGTTLGTGNASDSPQPALWRHKQSA